MVWRYALGLIMVAICVQGGLTVTGPKKADDFPEASPQSTGLIGLPEALPQSADLIGLPETLSQSTDLIGATSTDAEGSISIALSQDKSGRSATRESTKENTIKTGDAFAGLATLGVSPSEGDGEHGLTIESSTQQAPSLRRGSNGIGVNDFGTDDSLSSASGNTPVDAAFAGSPGGGSNRRGSSDDAWDEHGFPQKDQLGSPGEAGEQGNGLETPEPGPIGYEGVHLTANPEPTTLVLWGVLILGLAVLGRRRFTT